MRIALLGPLQVWDEAGTRVEVPGMRMRRLLARLALEPGRSIVTDSLADAVWDDQPSAATTSALQSLISRLRRSLGSAGARLESLPGGYRLDISTDAVDVCRFERLVAEGRAARDAGDSSGAAGRYAQALDLWRGMPLADLGPAPFATAAVARLEELRLRTIEDGVSLALTRGEADIAELAELTRAFPLRERIRALHMRDPAARA